MTFIVRGADKIQCVDVMCVELIVTSAGWWPILVETSVTLATRTLFELMCLLLLLLGLVGWLINTQCLLQLSVFIVSKLSYACVTVRVKQCPPHNISRGFQKYIHLFLLLWYCVVVMLRNDYLRCTRGISIPRIFSGQHFWVMRKLAWYLPICFVLLEGRFLCWLVLA